MVPISLHPLNDDPSMQLVGDFTFGGSKTDLRSADFTLFRGARGFVVVKGAFADDRVFGTKGEAMEAAKAA